MAPAAALTAQAEQRSSTGDRTKRKKAGTGIPAQSGVADFVVEVEIWYMRARRKVQVLTQRRAHKIAQRSLALR
jgi:hypothetical protein